MIQVNDSVNEAIMKLSQGNPGALRVLIEVFKHPAGGLRTLLDMDDMGMAGPSIWLGFKDFAKEDMIAFCAAVQRRDPEMVRVIKLNGGEAWTGGRS